MKCRHPFPCDQIPKSPAATARYKRGELAHAAKLRKQPPLAGDSSGRVVDTGRAQREERNRFAKGNGMHVDRTDEIAVADKTAALAPPYPPFRLLMMIA